MTRVAPAIVALALLACGGPSTPAPSDAPAVSDSPITLEARAIFDLWARGDVAAIARRGTDTFQEVALGLTHLVPLLHEAAGRMQSASEPFTITTNPGAVTVVTTEARYDKGMVTLTLELVARPDGLRVAGLQFLLPEALRTPASPATVPTVVEPVVRALLSADIATLRQHTHPSLAAQFGSDADMRARLRPVLAQLGTIHAANPIEQKECPAGQCVALELDTSKGKAHLSLDFTFVLTRWHLHAFDLVPPK